MAPLFREDRMPARRNSGAVYNLVQESTTAGQRNNNKQTSNQQQAQSPSTTFTRLHQQLTFRQQLSPHHHQAHLFMPQQQQQQLQQQQLHAACGRQAAHQQQTKLLGEMKPMFMSKEPATSMHSPHHQQATQSQPPLGRHNNLRAFSISPSSVGMRQRWSDEVPLHSSVASGPQQQTSLIMPPQWRHRQHCGPPVHCDVHGGQATLPHFSECLEDKSEISEKNCATLATRCSTNWFVAGLRKLPLLICEIPVEIHTKLLTDKLA
ncbi:Hormone receptor 4 [Lucilia cuprina]|nr:Hormone receptor 4 [Lucilia cuprina]